MNENLKTTIEQKLGSMSDENGRQLLDYIEFLESKFNRSSRERSTFERLAENVEGTLRSSRIGEAAIKGTGGIIDVAGAVARSFAAAGQAVLDELQQAVAEAEATTSQEAEGTEDEAQEGEQPSAAEPSVVDETADSEGNGGNKSPA